MPGLFSSGWWWLGRALLPTCGWGSLGSPFLSRGGRQAKDWETWAGYGHTGLQGNREPVGCAEPEAERCLAGTWLWVAQGMLLLLYLLLPHLQ